MTTKENPRRHLILLIALLLIIVLSPFVVTLRHGALIVNLAGAEGKASPSHAETREADSFPYKRAYTGAFIPRRRNSPTNLRASIAARANARAIFCCRDSMMIRRSDYRQ